MFHKKDFLGFCSLFYFSKILTQGRKIQQILSCFHTKPASSSWIESHPEYVASQAPSSTEVPGASHTKPRCTRLITPFMVSRKIESGRRITGKEVRPRHCTSRTAWRSRDGKAPGEWETDEIRLKPQLGTSWPIARAILFSRVTEQCCRPMHSPHWGGHTMTSSRDSQGAQKVFRPLPSLAALPSPTLECCCAGALLRSLLQRYLCWVPPSLS